MTHTDGEEARETGQRRLVRESASQSGRVFYNMRVFGLQSAGWPET